MNGDEKNKWIEEIIGSAGNAHRAHPPADLFHKIEQKLAGTLTVVRTIPLRTVSVAAASILLLAALNILVTLKSNQAKPQYKGDGMQQVAEYYGLTDNYGI